MRIHQQGVPFPLAMRFRGKGCWVLMRGYVVECRPQRDERGLIGYEVSLVFEPDAGPVPVSADAGPGSKFSAGWN